MDTFSFAEDYYGFDDALYAAVKIIEIINENEKKLSELVDEIPSVFNTPEIRIECEDKLKFNIIKNIVSKNLKENKRVLILMEFGFQMIMVGGYLELQIHNQQLLLDENHLQLKWS